MMISRRFVILFAGLLACAPPSSIKPSRSADVITREEIAASHAYTAYDVINLLRPNFLQSHGQTTITGSDTGLPKVYLNHQLYGDLESLRTFQVSGIREIHYYNGSEASSRFGLGNVSGAIEIITDAG
jgi:hypothetical protein